jgi:hypothetical protein
MAQPNEDPSMSLFRAMGMSLVSRATALTVAESIFKNIYGEDDFRTQVPLHIADGGDRWLIEGSRQAEDYPEGPGQPAKGKVEMAILKANCQILRLTQRMQLPSDISK